MELVKNSLKKLKENYLSILIFEFIWKAVTLFVLAPACAGLIQLTMKAAGLKYLTTTTLQQFISSPFTILLILFLLLLISLYTFVEISAVCTCFFQTSPLGVRMTLRRMCRAGIFAGKQYFTCHSPITALMMLLMIPLLQFSAASGIFASIGIPDFLSYYATKKEFVLPAYVALLILCTVLSVKPIFTSILMAKYHCDAKEARKLSIKLNKKRFFQTFFTIFLWNVVYFLLLLILIFAITFIVFGVTKLLHSDAVFTGVPMKILKYIIQVFLWIFSIMATPICMALLTSLLDIRFQQFPNYSAPKHVPVKTGVSRMNKPFRHTTAPILACVLILAGLGLNFSYIHSIFTGQTTISVSLYHSPSIMAHRGLSSSAPENTLYAFSDAIEIGADYIELDVQQTKDGVLVIMHDSNLKRTTGVDKNIWDVNYSEIEDLDAGSWFDPMYANARIPTLEQVLQFVDKQANLNIEIKPTQYGSDTLEQDVADLIDAYGYTNRCYVTSFSYDSLKKIKTYNPDIKTGYIMSVAYGKFYTLKYADAFSLNKVFVTKSVVNSAHQQGKKVFAWTVDSASEMRTLENLQVDSIITDNPLLAQSVINRSNTSDILQFIIDYLIN